MPACQAHNRRVPRAGATGATGARGDARFYNAEIVATARRAAARVSLTPGRNPSVDATIAAMGGVDADPIPTR